MKKLLSALALGLVTMVTIHAEDSLTQLDDQLTAKLLASNVVSTASTATSSTSSSKSGRNVIIPSSKLSSVTKSLKKFTKLSANSVIKVVYVQTEGANYTATITAPDNLIKYVKVTQNKNKVELSLDYPGNINGETNITVTIKSPQLNEVELSGAARFTSKSMQNAGGSIGFDTGGAGTVSVTTIKSAKLEIDAAGASDIKVGDFNGDYLELDASGAANISFKSASAPKSELDFSGAANVSMTLYTTNTSVECSGASNVSMTINSNTAQIECSGASNVTLNGKAAKASIESSGTSKVDAGKFAVSEGSITATGMSELTANVKKIISQETSSMAKLKLK